MANHYSLEVQALAASLARSASDDPTVLSLNPQAGELLLALNATWSRGWPPKAATWAI